MASGGELVARIAEMRQAAADIAGSAQRVNDAVDATNQQVSALGPDRFSSAAADTFRAEYNRLTAQLREAYDNLMLFNQKLLESADEIESASRPTA